MSRLFAGATSADSITFSPGSAAAAAPDQGPVTIAVLARADDTGGWTGWAFQGSKAGAGVSGLLTTNNVGAKLFAENDFSNGVSGLSTGWCWYVMTKAAGSSTPRWHVKDQTAATAWVHSNTDATVGDNTGAIDAIWVGGRAAGSLSWRGKIAAVALWGSVLADLAIEAACTSAAADLAAASPAWGTLLNQASTATAATDFTGGGGNQTAISGTSVSADDPPGFNYSLGATGDGAFALPHLTASGAGVATATGAGAFTLPHLTASGAGSASAAGAGAFTLPHLTATGVGVSEQWGAGTFTLPAFTASGVGVSAIPPPGGGDWNSLWGVINGQRADREAYQQWQREPSYCPVHFVPLDTNARGDLHCTPGGHLVRRG